MGITGLIPFLEKASRRTNVSEFSGCTVAIDSYCWLHKGAFACADKLVRGEDTDIHIKYCLKYVTMLLSKNIKPILVFDGRHLPAKALTEAKRRESRDIAKKRAAELLSLGQIDEARSYMRRSVDITHAMALALIKECRRRHVDCIVAPYEADAQLAYLNIKNIAHLVITEDSDLILFGCTKVLFKMDLEGTGTLVETNKLPLVMKCPIERFTMDKFRQMCIMSGCDYIASLPGIGLAKARQFLNATRDTNIANALKKLPSFFNKSSLVVTDEYREGFLKAEATFKHQYVYDPIDRVMVRLTDVDDEEVEAALCVNAGEWLDAESALQLALGNLDPFTMKRMDDWHPDRTGTQNGKIKTDGWNEKGVSPHPSIWQSTFRAYLSEPRPWLKKVKKSEPIIAIPKSRPVKKVVNLVSKYVPETQDQSLTIESLSTMYCAEPASKKQKITPNTESQPDSQEPIEPHNQALLAADINTQEISYQKEKSPILENKERSFRKCMKNASYSVLKRLSKFPRTVVDENVVESKFFSPNAIETKDEIEESPEKLTNKQEIDTQCSVILDSQDEELPNSQKENSPVKKVNNSPILEPSPRSRNPFRVRPLAELTREQELSEDSVIENTYPMETLVTPVDSQISYGDSQADQESNPKPSEWRTSAQISPPKPLSQPSKTSFNGYKKGCRVSGLRKTASLPSNQPTLLSKFGFQKRAVMKR